MLRLTVGVRDRIYLGRRVGNFDPERRSGRVSADPTWKSRRPSDPQKFFLKNIIFFRKFFLT